MFETTSDNIPEVDFCVKHYVYLLGIVFFPSAKNTQISKYVIPVILIYERLDLFD